MPIELAGLTKSFGTVHAVRGIDLTVRPGEIVALLGPNGAGKTTTIDMMLDIAATGPTWSGSPTSAAGSRSRRPSRRAGAGR